MEYDPHRAMLEEQARRRDEEARIKRQRDEVDERIRRRAIRADDHQRLAAHQAHESPRVGRGAATKPVVWLFGLIGAFLFGVYRPFGVDWPVAAFAGFIIGGVGAGMLSEHRIGKIILTVFALGFAALIVGVVIYARVASGAAD